MAELPPPRVGADEARDLADQVLAGRAYVEAARPPSLQQRLFDWIAERFSDLFNALSSTGGRGLIAWLIIGGFAVFIAFLLTRLFRNVGTLPVRKEVSNPDIEVLGNRSAEDWIAAAREAEADGDWRLGVRCRHRALVTTLVRRNIVVVRPGQTAGEIQRQVAVEHPAASDAMQEATWLFKDVWYGWIDADESSSGRFDELSMSVLASVDEATDRQAKVSL